jgi:ABC-type sulfate/molybdate transport systems ATPase subunit
MRPSTLNLTDYLDRKPRALSGGQRQRVAIGRAIVREPKAFLFDEPLSNLDAALRVNMRFEITELHQQLKTTMVYVTHDQVEAMTMADRIVVLNAGRIEQFGSPLELYKHPANRFVAGFIGSPKMNFLEGAEAAGKYQARRHRRAPRAHAAVARQPENGRVGSAWQRAAGLGHVSPCACRWHRGYRRCAPAARTTSTPVSRSGCRPTRTASTASTAPDWRCGEHQACARDDTLTKDYAHAARTLR